MVSAELLRTRQFGFRHGEQLAPNRRWCRGLAINLPKKPHIIIFATILISVTITAALFYTALYAPLQTDRRVVEERMTDCIEKLEAVVNAESPNYKYGMGDYLYDPETNRCLYRGHFTTGTLDDWYFEKFIVDASA